ncbi:TRAP transporter large permease subunit [Allopusillimonas soli]|uniref:TRAP transporter large permease subunit n=1 Tax=Allopusillimonas soli TaxID=659016 RepID=A0A853FBP5_9BURK|nr:TRAP transporter large permease subunit [Allopusillimonas soli]NYT37377.1 TRAP transporter large permease subunit [Allopusillimonas soli]TEA74641.1 TRAP transporter large permease subunit [Allopusillimonas soli]
MTDPMLGLISLLVAVVGVLTGFPMAFVFIFVALLFGFMAIGQQVFNLLTYQFFALMTNVELTAVPLFLFMGYVLEQSGLMDRMFKALQMILGGIKGSLYVIVLATATLFAAATGIVGASVTVLGVMAAPMLIRSNYDTRLSAGSIAAGGTLGILIPPSIMLIVMGPLVGVPVSTLFAAAVIPGLLLAVVYIIYTIIRCHFNPALGPALKYDGPHLSALAKTRELIVGIIPITIVIMATLGLIIGGITTPTDAAATGAFASLVLTALFGRLKWKPLKTAVFRTLETSAFIMFLIGAANFFGAVFARMGSGRLITETLTALQVSPTVMLLLMLFMIFVLGGPLEWIPIVLVVVPILLPVAQDLGFDMLWFCILIAVTLQTSWLTPPLALSSYFLKGVVPQWSMKDIYLGMVQFVALQILVVFLLINFPILVHWLPQVTGLLD